MDDQFGGRTDDDLFYDDLEPVDSHTVAAEDTSAQSQSSSQQPSTPSQTVTATTQPKSTPSAPAHKGLASSRYAPKDDAPPSAPAAEPAPTAQEPQAESADGKPESGPEAATAPPPNAPTAPREKRRQNNAISAARLQSGANPRQKLTEAELAEKMEKMKLVTAEKTAAFKKAEQDEKQHAQAYAKGMEEAKKRRAEEAQRRKRGEEDRKRLEDERAKNRERKLKAMGMKEGGWDEGKEEREQEEAPRYRGANGGIRGHKSAGLAGSRYARNDGEEQPDVDRFLEDRPRGGGRGRGRGGRGGRGGGRGGLEGQKSQPPKQTLPSTNDFPALPGDGNKSKPAPQAGGDQPKKTVAAVAAAAVPQVLPLAPIAAGGKWADDVEDDQADAANN